jgi:amidase
VLETVEALRKAGHECIQIDAPDGAWRNLSPIDKVLDMVPVTQALRLFTAITSADGYKKLTEHLGPDPKVWSSKCFPL